MTVLIVEDNEMAARLHAGLLADWGFEFVWARDGWQALNVLHKEERIGLVLTDLVMPGLDGVDFIKRMRSDPDVTKVPAVMITAFPDYRQDEVKKLGVPVVKKPVASKELLEVVKKVTGIEAVTNGY